MAHSSTSSNGKRIIFIAKIYDIDELLTETGAQIGAEGVAPGARAPVGSHEVDASAVHARIRLALVDI